MLKSLLLGAALVAAALPATAQHLEAGDIVLHDPWIRATTSVARSSGAFLTISNTGAEDDRLLSAKAEFARIEVHRTATTPDGINRMEEQEEGIALPAGEDVMLAPGGFHLMLMGLDTGIPEGETRAITLIFERAGAVVLDFPARRTAPEGHDAHGHDAHGNGMHGTHGN